MSATSLGLVCDQDSVMEFGFFIPAANLVADRFAAGLSQIPLRYPGRRPGRRLTVSWNLAYHALSNSLTQASRSATGLRPASDLSATRIA